GIEVGVVVLPGHELGGLLARLDRREGPEERTAGGFLDEAHGDEGDHREEHDVERRHVRVARDVDERLCEQRGGAPEQGHTEVERDRKSTRLNSSHVSISYAVFCLNNTILR